MPDDEFSKQAGKAIQATVATAAGLVSGPAGAVLAVGAAVTFNVFEALAARNDEALREFRVAALEDEMIAVRDKMHTLEALLLAQGTKPDRQDPLTQNAVASEFVHGVTEARTVEKKEALVNVTVAQFDPRRGSPAIRDHWLRRVREMPEAELSFLLLLAQHRIIAFTHGQMFWADGGGRSGPLGFLEADTVAYRAIAEVMTNAGHGSLIYRTDATIAIESTAVPAVAFVLKKDGEVLVSFCKDG